MDIVKLYTARICPYAERARLVLAAKNIPSERVEIDLQNKPEWFKEVSPLGKVPVIQHNGKTIWESAIIMEYLDEAFPGVRLLGETPYERAMQRIWIDWSGKMIMNFYRFLTHVNPEDQEKYRKDLENDLQYMNDMMKKTSENGPFLTGNKLGLADLAIIPWFERFVVLKKARNWSLPQGLDRVEKWLAAMEKEPAYQKEKEADPNYFIEAYRRYYEGKVVIK